MSKSPDAFRTISEVAEALDTPAHVLRFWESRFSQVKPVKRAGGRRYYRPSDMALLAGIRKLLHDDGMTIKGVQKVLREKGVRHVSALGRDSTSLFDDDNTALADPAEPETAPDSPPQASVLPFRISPTTGQDDQPDRPVPEPDQPPGDTPRNFDWADTAAENAADTEAALPPVDDSLADFARPFAEAMDDHGPDTSSLRSGDTPSMAPGAEDSLADYVRPFAEAVLAETELPDAEDQAQLDLPPPDTWPTDASEGDTAQETPAPGPDAPALPVLPVLPDDPDLSQLPPRPGRLPPVAGLTRLSRAQAANLAPLLTRLRHVLDGHPGNPA